MLLRLPAYQDLTSQTKLIANQNSSGVTPSHSPYLFVSFLLPNAMRSVHPPSLHVVKSPKCHLIPM